MCFWAPLPPSASLAGTYVGPHLRRKLLLAAIRGLGPGSKKLKIGLGSALNGLDAVPARIAIRLTGPDQTDFASTVPAVMRAGRLARILGAPIEFIGVFACLWKEACDRLPDLEHFLELHASSLPQVLQQYIWQHGVTPCPYLLVERAMQEMCWAGVSGAPQGMQQDIAGRRISGKLRPRPHARVDSTH